MKQLDPKAVWIFFINSVLSLFAVITTLNLGFFWLDLGEIFTEFEFLFGTFNWSLFELLITIPVFLILCFIWAKLTYHFYRYELTKVGFNKEFGVISKKYMTIPYDRIQNVTIHRNILARIFGLSDINIQTAGMSVTTNSSEGQLPALSQKDAERLRDELIQRARQAKNQEL